MLRIRTERITRGNLARFKDVRLRSLLEAPYAFGSTYAREAAFDDAEWMQRLERWNGEDGVGFLAMEQDVPCGIAGCLVDPQDPARAQLVAMWTAPAHRERGIGRLLVNAVLDWARGRDVRVLQLMVTSNNEAAIRFYERLGFTRTGRTEPDPNDPAVIEYEMAQAIL